MANAKRKGAFKPLTAITPPALKLDFGCGPNPREGFEGVDQYAFDGKVKHVFNICQRAHSVDQIARAAMHEPPTGALQRWPWSDASVAEAHASHFVEHLTATERCHFVNELYRVLVPGGVCTIIIPHWASCRAYGDPTHQWPPVSEFWFYYLSREWRLGDPAKNLGANAPHTDVTYNPDGFNCNFVATWGYNLRGDLGARNQEYQQFAIQNYKEVCLDMVGTLTKA